jgi:hypothetical protein
MVEPMPDVARVDAVVSHHLDGFRSGVARFNELLAERLDVPVLGLEALASGPERPLLSFKVRELDDRSAGLVESWLAGATDWDVFLHEYADLELERRLVQGARRVLCGNREIHARVTPLNSAVETLWTPGLILDDRKFPEVEVSVFTFGMAHKIRADLFLRLRDLLDATGRSYAVYVSAANHETASLRDSEDVFAEMHELFRQRLFFLGNLSDVAVYNWLISATFFASFFPGGVRGNNTSIASAMERGAAIVTNLDEWSPAELVHGENVVDVLRCERLPVEDEELDRLRRAAAETATGKDWDALVRRIRA